MDRIKQRFAMLEEARAWYESAALPGFSGQTARQLVEAGRGQDVIDYIEAVDAGVFS